VLDKVKSQLETAHRTLENTGVRARAMHRRLRDVETLPGEAARSVLGLDLDGSADTHTDDASTATGSGEPVDADVDAASPASATRSDEDGDV
jgi:DNA anti-recombination protein RmuC